VCSVIGARLLYVFTNLERFDSFFDIFKVWQGGLVAYGGFLGGFATGVIMCTVKKIKLLAWADCVVPSLGTGLAFTRVGCFMFGCDFGKVMEPVKWWAVRFPKDSPAWAEQIKQGLIAQSATHSLPVHPTQIYEMLVGFTLFGLTMLVRRYRTFSGQTFIAFTMGYAVLRFYLETLRADEQRGELGPFSTSQIIGIGTFLAAGALFFALRAIRKKDPTRFRYWEAAAVAPEPAPKKRRRKR
jgi:phosphatidylglycerol:prolipoprotein diacylglycerol transferase